MGILLKDRDYAADGAGSVVTASGGDALVNEALFRLTARRGSFPFLPELGSRMYLLGREKPSAWQSVARQYAAEALEGLAGVSVTDAAVSRTGENLTVMVSLLWQGTDLTVTVQLEG